MKILACLLICSCSLFSQEMTSEGSVTIGGKISYASVNYRGNSSSSFDFSPQVSLFMWDNLELGIAMTLGSQNGYGYSQTNYGIGPFLNLYLSENKTQPFLGVSYASTKVGSSSYYYDDHPTSVFTVLAGVSIPLNQKVALQPVIQYSFYKANTYDPSLVTEIKFGLSVKAFL